MKRSAEEDDDVLILRYGDEKTEGSKRKKMKSNLLFCS